MRAAQARIALERRNRELQTTLDKSFAFPGILGQTHAMQRVFDVMNQIKDTDATVLDARASPGPARSWSPARCTTPARAAAAPFIPLNCAALAEGVLESELFGHEQGAFTGATGRRKGRFEAADGGTLFLDEIGDMPLATQAHLLRALSRARSCAVGGQRARARSTCASSPPPTATCEAMVARRAPSARTCCFRLRVVQLELPPLRERLADLPAPRRALPRGSGRAPRQAGPRALARGPRHPHELPLARQRARAEERRRVHGAAQPGRSSSRPDAVPPYVRPAGGDMPDILKSLSGLAVEDVERALITNTLRDVGGNRERASQLLGISTRTLYRKIKAYGLSRRDGPRRSAEPD